MSFHKRITCLVSDVRNAAAWAAFGARVVRIELVGFRAELARVRGHCGL
jgi:hypothetical protein